MSTTLTAMQRVLTTLGHSEPDRVPVFLLLTMHGARELGLSMEEYFSKPQNVVEGQLRLRKKFGHDCYYGLLYAAVEHQAFGGQAIFSLDGPVNAGAPVIRSRDDIYALQVPDIAQAPRLQHTLEVIRQLAAAAKGEVPVLGCVVSPFSSPVMMMGFERYLDLLHEDREAWAHLMGITSAFAVAWANAQYAAGATALAYFDPLSACDVTEAGLWRATGLPIGKAAIAQFAGPTALHLASGRGLARIAEYPQLGSPILGVSAKDDLAALKRACAGHTTLIGNLNGITLARLSPAEIEAEVRAAIDAAGAGGGFILSDNHGEIPFQVPDSALHAIMAAAERWGTYPLAPHHA